MTSPFGAPRADIPRGNYGKPLVRLPDGSDLVEYERASSYGKAIDSGDGLLYWAKCMVLKGASRNPALLEAAKPLEYDTEKRKLYELAEQAMVLAGAGNKAALGTARHSLTDLHDAGEALPEELDDHARRDLEAYKLATVGLEVVEAERFVVCDELRVGGSFDRKLRVLDVDPWPSWLRGRTVIGDLKTGNAEGAIASIAVQLAIYSRSALYDPETGARTPLGADQSVGLVVHLPLNGGECNVLAVDLETGWKGAKAAEAARAYQKAARLACKLCDPLNPGFYKNGGPCRVCKGVARVPIAVNVRREVVA